VISVKLPSEVLFGGSTYLSKDGSEESPIRVESLF